MTNSTSRAICNKGTMALIIEFKTTWRPAETTEGSTYLQENKIQRGYKMRSSVPVSFCSPSPELIILMMQRCTLTDYLPQKIPNISKVRCPRTTKPRPLRIFLCSTSTSSNFSLDRERVRTSSAGFVPRFMDHLLTEVTQKWI